MKIDVVAYISDAENSLETNQSRHIIAEEQKDPKQYKKNFDLQEIIQIARLTKSVRESVESYEDKTRPIIDAKNFGDEIKILHYTY